MLKINKKMIGTTIYRGNTSFKSNPYPRPEAIITKVGSKYVYIDDIQYEINTRLSNSEYLWLNGNLNNSIIIFTSKEKYDAHLFRKEFEKKLTKLIDQHGNNDLYSIPIDNIKQAAKLLLLNLNE